MKQPHIQVYNYTFKNQGSGTLDVHVDGDIVDAPTQEVMRNWWGDETSVSFKSFRDQITGANPSVINLYVNSPGGHVGDAMAMHDYLDELESKGVTVNRKGRGIIASAATYLMMGKNSEMSENSMMMIHNVQMMAYGDINQVQNQVNAGKKFNDLVKNFYVNQTGQPKETVSAWMNKETWFNAQEAKDYGFVKNISGQASFKNSIKPEKWPFENKAILNTYNSFTTNKKIMKAENITSALVNAMKNMGIVKKSVSDETLNKVCGEIANTFKTEFENSVKTAVDEAVKNGGAAAPVDVIAQVETAIANVLKQEGEGSVAHAITNAATEAVNSLVPEKIKNLATKEEVTAVKNDMKTLSTDVANKLGGKGTASEEETETDRKVNNKRGFFKVGNFGKTA